MNAPRAIWQGLVRLLHPPTCWVCEQLCGECHPLVCESCRHELTHDPHPSCWRCSTTVGPFARLDDGCPACRGQTFAFAQAFRMAPYEGRLRDVILRMKTKSGEDLAEALGALWARHMAPRLAGLGVDAVVPVPLHWQRRLRRGFNGGDALARFLAGELKVPALPRLLRWSRRTGEQKGLPPTARRDNVRDAFHASPAPALTKKTIVLVDDVMTTGATGHEAARALRQGGAERVILAVLAHGR